MRTPHWRAEVDRHGSSHNDFLMLTTLVIAMILATGFCVTNHVPSLPTTVAIVDR